MSEAPALRVTDLRYRYPGADRDAVDLPRLELASGEQALLVAPSGRGKSTLLHLIAGLIDPTAGTVEVGGTDIHAARGPARDRLRGERIGMVFQTFHLLHGFSALENVMLALTFTRVPPREHRARASELLARLGIDRPDAPPEALSVGQQQRVAVARALAPRPALVLADEPTASLDPENAAGAVRLLEDVCREAGAALLCVSHDPALRERFGTVLSLEGAAA